MGTQHEYSKTRLLGLSGLVVLLLSPGCLVSFSDWPDSKVTTGGAQALGGSVSSGGEQAASGGAGGDSTTGGVANGGQGAERIVWLTLENDQAKNTTFPNDSLGINGVVFAYADGCASITFDRTTRCVSGKTCAVDSSYLNWGMAAEFDFVVDSADVKYAWNPAGHGVVGFAWQITNSYGTYLQLWVPLMDPTYAGVCSAESCSLDAPPYGAGKIGQTGTLHFNSMTQDTWGSGYPTYNFLFANVYSLQFKIPTVVVRTAANFEFCIDRLGVIVSE